MCPFGGGAMRALVRLPPRLGPGSNSSVGSVCHGSGGGSRACAACGRRSRDEWSQTTCDCARSRACRSANITLQSTLRRPRRNLHFLSRRWLPVPCVRAVRGRFKWRGTNSLACTFHSALSGTAVVEMAVAHRAVWAVDPDGDRGRRPGARSLGVGVGFGAGGAQVRAWDAMRAACGSNMGRGGPS